MREMRKNLGLSGKLRKQHQKERWFLDAASVYCQAVGALADSLSAVEPGSAASWRSGEYLADYIQSGAFTDLAEDVAG